MAHNLFYAHGISGTRVFYAHHDSKTPYYIGAVIVVKAVLDWALVKPLGVGGINLSTTLATIFNLSVLSFLLSRRIGSLGYTKLIKPVLIMLFASAAAFMVAHYVAAIFTSHMLISHFATLLLAVTISSIASLAVYVMICLALHLDEPHMVLKRLQAAKLQNTKS